MRSRTLDSYADRYAHAHFERRDGVLLVTLHSDGRDLHWGAGPHQELGWCFADIAGDRENEVVILTGMGDAFCARYSAGPAEQRPTAEWDHVYDDGKRLLKNLLDIPVPMIAAVNGPATVHAELALLCDVVLAADTAVFGDAPHYQGGLVPGDGSHIVWPLLLGPNRGRHFLLTGQELAADEAERLGIVAEVTARSELVDRAFEVAEVIRRQPQLTRRYAREALTMPFKRALAEDLPHGLALEGLAAADNWPSGYEVRPAR